MPYISDADASLFSGTDAGLRLGVFFYLGLRAPSSPLRLWAGVNDVPIGIPSVDPAGTVYLGAGRLVNIPDLELLINGIADRVEFTLAGTDKRLGGIIKDAPPVLGAQAIVGLAPLDERYQPQTQIIGVWTGVADVMKAARSPGAKATDAPMQSVTVSCSSGDTSRARPRLTAFDQAQQHALSPTDNFFSQINRYTQQYLVSWPKY